MQKVGFDALGIDWRYNRDTPVCKVLSIDLLLLHRQALLRRILQDERVVYAHLAPPCGTASAARNIRRRRGPDPKPLRDTAHPDGLLSLQGVNKERVEAANTFYSLAAELEEKMYTNGVA